MAAQPTVALAHGVHGSERQVYVGPAGPFEVRVRSTTAVGDVHVTVFVTEGVTGIVVPDATVMVSLRDESGELPDVGPERGVPIIAGSNGYVSVLAVEEPGARILVGQVASSGGLGNGMFEVPIPMTNADTSPNWGLVVVLLVLVAFAIWPMRRRNGKPRRGGGPSENDKND